MQYKFVFTGCKKGTSLGEMFTIYSVTFHLSILLELRMFLLITIIIKRECYRSHWKRQHSWKRLSASSKRVKQPSFSFVICKWGILAVCSLVWHESYRPLEALLKQTELLYGRKTRQTFESLKLQLKEQKGHPTKVGYFILILKSRTDIQMNHRRCAVRPYITQFISF